MTKPKRNYTGINEEELQALANCSGEAVRLYIALCMFCYGPKSTGFASKEQIMLKMHKQSLMEKKGWKTNMNKLFSQLEKAGLFDWGDKRRAWNATNKWALPIKATVVATSQVKSTRQSSKKYSGGQVKNTSTSSNKHSEGQVKSTHHNNKSNNKSNNKNEEYNIIYKIIEHEGLKYRFREVPTDRIEKHTILHDLETTKTYRILWDYYPPDILEWLEHLLKSKHTFPNSKAKMIRYLEEFDYSDIDPVDSRE